MVGHCGWMKLLISRQGRNITLSFERFCIHCETDFVIEKPPFITHVIDVDPHLPMRKENPETRSEEKGSKEVDSVVALVVRGYFVRGWNFSRI
jgi:hypothetical protein